MEPTGTGHDRHPARRRGGTDAMGKAPDGNQPAPAGRGSPGWPAASGLVAVAVWGLAPVATRALVTHLAPRPLLVVRLGAASFILLPWCGRCCDGGPAGRSSPGC